MRRYFLCVNQKAMCHNITIRYYVSFHCISKDRKLLLTARIIRTFAYGFLTIIIAIYLRTLGVDNIHSGILLGFTLLKSVVFTLFGSFYADRIGRKKILIIYASLMSLSGAILSFTVNHILMVLVAL
jgi:MFS family permease